MGCPCGKLSPDVPSQVSQHKRPRASESLWASLLQDRGSGDSAETRFFFFFVAGEGGGRKGESNN